MYWQRAIRHLLITGILTVLFAATSATVRDAYRRAITAQGRKPLVGGTAASHSLMPHVPWTMSR